MDISHCICALIKGHRSTAILMLNCHYLPETELPRVQGLTFLRNRLRTNKCNILSSSPLYSWLYVQRLTLRTLLSHTILCSPIPSHGNSSTSTTCLDHSQSSPSEYVHQKHSLSRSLSYRSNPWASHQMHFFIIHRDFVVCRCGESAPPSHSHSAKQQSISWPTDNGEIILRTCDTCKWVTLNLIKLYVKVKSNKTPRLLCSTWLNNSPPARDSAGLHIMMPVGYRKAI